MITFLKGKLVEAFPDRVIMDVSGVGYQVLIPVSCFDHLPAIDEELIILTHHHITDSDQVLYGFLQSEERDFFRLLIGRVSGVGPKIGLAVLGGLGVEAFKQAVVEGNITTIAAVKGLGKKTAERIVLELKDKVGIVETWEASGRDSRNIDQSGGWADAHLALISLGYRQADAKKVLSELRNNKQFDESASVSGILKEALRSLS
jgi:Holliday junction DNA helicase RuvA